MSTSSSILYHEQVLISNGSRLSSTTAESLRFRGLIEPAERLPEPQLPPGYPEQWRKQLILFSIDGARLA